MEKLRERYYNPSKTTSFGGVNRFLQGVKSKHKSEKLEHFLKGERAYTLHRPKRVNFPTRAVLVFKPTWQYQADLVDLGSIKQYNDGFRYILNCIDCFSRMAFSRPQKSKTASETAKSFKDILETSNLIPRKLQTDRDQAFYGKQFKTMLKDYGIQLFSVHTPIKAALVERYNRTLLTKLFRYLTHKGDYRWVDVLPTLVNTYNRTKHRSIGMAPIEVSEKNRSEVFRNIHNRKYIPSKGRGKTRLQIGDYVRLSRLKDKFEKGYTQTWSDEIFQIHSIKKGMPDVFTLIDLNGVLIAGSVYFEELQKINYSGDDEIFAIDRIIEERGRKVKVRWKGYNKDFDSWIDRGAIEKIK